MTMTEAVQKRIEGLCWERHISINKLSEMSKTAVYLSFHVKSIDRYLQIN